MKKKWYYVFISLIILGILLVTDYYQAVFVSNSDLKKEVKIDKDKKVLEEKEFQSQNEKEVVSLAFLGDNMIHESVLNWANVLGGGGGERNSYNVGFDFEPMYEMVSSYIDKSDFSVCNQTSLVGASDELSGYPLFNSPKKLGYDLISLGFDGINIANNHMLDLSDAGYRNSVLFWRDNPVCLFGGYQNVKEMEETKNRIYNVKGIQIGFLSYTGNTNGIIQKNSETPIPYYTFRDTVILSKKITDDISRVKRECDFLVVLINWSNDANEIVTDHQREVANLLANAGADLIVGSGPKTLQEITSIQTVDNREVICAFSLGNLMGTMENMNNLLGGILCVDLKQESDKISISNVHLVPTVIHYDAYRQNISVYPIAQYNEDLLSIHGCNLNGRYSLFDLKSMIDKRISGEFL